MRAGVWGVKDLDPRGISGVFVDSFVKRPESVFGGLLLESVATDLISFPSLVNHLWLRISNRSVL